MATIDLNNAYYGRKWQILISLNDGTVIDVTDSEFGDYALRAQFSIEIQGYTAITYADVTLWNLSAETDNKIGSQMSGTVIINAGYVNGAYGQIFVGQIFQILRGRENQGVDYTLTLHCVDGHGIYNNNVSAFTAVAGLTQQQQIYSVCQNAKSTITVGTITEDLDSTALPRGKVFFGEPKKYLKQIAANNNAQFYVTADAVNITKFTDTVAQTIVASPPSADTKTLATGATAVLIGYPQQIPYGINATILLNPNIKMLNPPMNIKLDQSTIREQLKQIGSVPTLLEQDGIYKVAKLTHRGDTRGNEWYTDITGIITQGMIPFNMTNPN